MVRAQLILRNLRSRPMVHRSSRSARRRALIAFGVVPLLSLAIAIALSSDHSNLARIAVVGGVVAMFVLIALPLIFLDRDIVGRVMLAPKRFIRPEEEFGFDRGDAPDLHTMKPRFTADAVDLSVPPEFVLTTDETLDSLVRRLEATPIAARYRIEITCDDRTEIVNQTAERVLRFTVRRRQSAAPQIADLSRLV
jgi:hypothetical protein